MEIVGFVILESCDGGSEDVECILEFCFVDVEIEIFEEEDGGGGYVEEYGYGGVVEGVFVVEFGGEFEDFEIVIDYDGDEGVVF